MILSFLVRGMGNKKFHDFQNPQKIRHEITQIYIYIYSLILFNYIKKITDIYLIFTKT